ncbi:unnamed protein product [Lactuca virosa]|uniref:RRM domain-containing protein n=1 Tax=Lactuca virosa TaxID=75947 RepID=A0AAU9LZW7_9ASTR|nr:unnamed protein product [Lactuca virosa]
MTFHNHYECNIGTKKSNGTSVNPNQREIERLSATFFVTNFPNNLNEKDLWKMFDENAKVGNYHLFVSLARFKRDHKNIPKPTGDNQVHEPGKKRNNHGIGAEQVHRNSYANILRGSNGEKKQEKAKTTKIISLAAGDFMTIDDSTKIVLGKVKDASIIPQLYSLCSVEGFEEVEIKYVGGRWVWFQFMASTTCVLFKQHGGIKKYFYEVIPVSKSFVVKERAVWLEIQGLPLYAWSITAYKKIAGMYGKVLFADEDLDEQLSSGKKPKDDAINDGEAQKEENDLSDDEDAESIDEESENEKNDDGMNQFLPDDPVFYNDKFVGLKEGIIENVSSDQEFYNKDPVSASVNSKKVDS